MKNSAEWYKRFNDDLYDMYNTSGEATAVHIVRDIVKNINTKSKWIDVVSMDTDCSSYSNFDFNWIIVELFPKMTRPQYTEYLEILPSDDNFSKREKEITNRRIREENRYITWQASHNDIEVHRSRNHHGEKFIVLCRLNRKRRKATKGEDDYIITAINKISQKQIDYIIDHQNDLSEKIILNGKATLDILNVPLKNRAKSSPHEMYVGEIGNR